MDNPYKYADRAIALLNKKAVKRFNKAKRTCALSGFDELNVLQTIDTLYQELEEDNKETFLRLAILCYLHTKPHGKRKPDLTWLLLLLEEYNPVTLYIYNNEVIRKRDYAKESIVSAKQKRKEFKRALVYWSRFTAQYADIVTDAARMQAFHDAGVQYVMWNTEKDDRVCKECKPLDGKIFPIDKAPPKKHRNCRCFYTPVLEDV